MNRHGCGCSSVCAALAALLLASAGWGQLPRPTRQDQANNHLRIKEWMYGAKIGRTVTVATTGGDYSTLAAAVAYVTTQTPSAVAPWTVLVYDGDHSAAPVALPSWVSVVFLGGIDDDGERSGIAVRTGAGYDYALKVTGGTNISAGGGNYFETIDAPAGTDPVADSASDTLVVTCSGGLTCTGTAATDTLALALPLYAASTSEGGPATTAAALAANGSNCSAGSYPLGVDAAGAVEGCTVAGTGTIGGTLGTTADAIPVADGAGGLTAKASTVKITSGAVIVQDGSDAATGIRFSSHAAGTGFYGAGATGISFAQNGGTKWTISNASIASQNGGAIRNAGAGEPIFAPVANYGLGNSTASAATMYAGGFGIEEWTRPASGINRVSALGQAGDTPQAATCLDSGDANPGALTINPTTALVYITVSDADGCAFTLGETNVTSGLRVELVVVAGSGTFSDTSGVSELAGGFVAGVYDVLSVRYIADRWVETGRSDN